MLHEIMTPETSWKMCISSWCCLPWSKKVVGSLPMGFMLCPLAVRGDISEGRRLNGCSLSSVNSCGPAAEISAPESGRTDVTVDPFAVVMCILMVGAGSAVVTCLRVDSWLGVGSVVVLVWGGICIAFANEVAGGCGVTGWVVARARHTLAKCPIFPQWWQVLS